ncbi:elongation of very long chain fatty acids protein 6-like [Diorhabda sublineata]|uniref:elongation of very long chain fatty acids protein 6-like n=1 Tax=Diorhabda sublineata TaxID=1163346 RepID=UPI0024E1913B|nr:elongation of very long chain fatty acids protein 6-like [Diorhabda sublineata]
MEKYARVTSPNYTYLFNFESDFIHKKTLKWMEENWTSSFYYVGLYVFVIFGGRYWMQNRPKFELRTLLVAWNLMLATFSIMGACRTLPEFTHILTHHGLYHSICIPSFVEQDKVSGFWAWMFTLSKLPELGDTVFIVLRKQPLIFLHWYHHITVLLYSWLSYAETSASARWFMVMNYCVHSLMYSYYALKAMRYSPPKQLAMIITSLQITQMLVGCAISLWVRRLILRKTDCHITILNNSLALVMYFSYFVLFVKFFYYSYMSRNKTIKTNISAVNDVYALIKSKTM